MKKIILLLGFLSFCSAGWCLEEVNFLSEPGPHSPFKVKRAKAKGETLPPKEKIELTGYLGRPDTHSPSPAIVLLHSGFGLQQYHKTWAKELTHSGFVTLLIHSYSGINHKLKPKINESKDVVSNAYGAYEFLRNQSYVDPTRIGVMGWSSGGRHAFSLISEEMPPGRVQQKQFKAGVMIYPNCSPDGGSYRSPMLILLGDNDQYLVNGDCSQFKAETQRLNNRQTVDVHVYPGATHFYDDSSQPLEGDQTNTETRYRYNSDAHSDSINKVLQFMHQHLNKQGLLSPELLSNNLANSSKWHIVVV